MSSNSETGHVKNMDGGQFIIDRCITFGPTYNPSNLRLTVANMGALRMSCHALHVTYKDALMAAKDPINIREARFEYAYRIVIKSIHYFESTDASDAIIADARGLVRKFTGSNIKVKRLPDGTKDPSHVSNSQQSYVQRQDTFNQLVQLYAGNANYAPNEVELQIVQLEALANELHVLNNDMNSVLAPVTAAKIERDHALYDAEAGLVDVMLACKKYVKSVFGVNSPEYKSISGVKFTKPKA